MDLLQHWREFVPKTAMKQLANFCHEVTEGRNTVRVERGGRTENNRLYCILLYLYIYTSASCSAHQSEALLVRETQREESR